MDQTIRLGQPRPDRCHDDGRDRGRGRGRAARAELVGAVGATALQIGLAARALDMTVGYSKERVQFGRPIGSFQALKHRMADMLVLLEMSRSASWSASYAVSTSADNAAELTHIAKSYCSEALATIAGETSPAARRHRDHLGARRPPGVQARPRARPAVRRAARAPGPVWSSEAP